MAAGGKSFLASMLLHGAVVVGAAGWAMHPSGPGPAEAPGNDVAGVALFLDRDEFPEPPAAAEPEMNEIAETTPPAPLLPETSDVIAETMPDEELVVPLVKAPAIIAPSGAPRVVTQPAAQKAKSTARTSPATRGKGGENSGAIGGGGGSYSPASYLRCPAPAFPAVARRERLSGTVLLFVIVDEKGRPTDVMVRRSSGHEVLDSAAIASVRRWKFSPAQMNGEPVTAKLEVPVKFASS